MSGKIYLHLLLFCGILWQGIFATYLDEHSKLSLDFLLRKRRVINHTPHQARDLTRIEEVYYIVRIKENNRSNCAGVILSHYTVLTAASCARQHMSNYSIFSGAAHDPQSNFHNVTSIVKYYGSLSQQPIDGIALLTVDPPFVYSTKTGNINFHQVPLPVGTQVTVSGWGWSYPLQPGPGTRIRLNSITLPIMNREECENIYRSNSIHSNMHYPMTVTEKHICTYCAQRYCAHGDIGAPLVVNNFLAGIHVWKGEFPDRRNPDVYINLQRADYRDWINENALLM